MKALYVDAFSGISGNMFVGGLLDLGLPEEYLRSQLELLPIDGYRLVIEKTDKCGIQATYFNVILTENGCFGEHEHTHNHHIQHGHSHEHHGHNESGQHSHAHHHGHRNLQDILAIIEGSKLDSKVKSKAAAVFQKLADAEGKIHGKPSNQVNFHEVGAIDTIIDIVGTVAGLDYLGIEKIFAGKIRTGFGFVDCAHGRMPVPAPATAELLSGFPFYAGDIEKEMTTPTGAALLAVLAEASPDLPVGFVVEKTAYGAGTYDLAIPNALRLFMFEASAREMGSGLYVLETNIDDMNPQLYGHVMNKIFAAGAADVWITPIIMKKGRPACKMSALMEESLLAEVSKTVFMETSSLGVRYYPVMREIADRRTMKVELSYGQVHVKLGEVNGKVVNIAPEFDDCSRLAALTGLPVKRIWQEATQKALEKEHF